MLRVLVGPEHPIGVVLANPVLVHVGQKVQLAIRGEPFVNRLPCVGRNGGATRLTVGGVGRRLGIVLSAIGETISN